MNIYRKIVLATAGAVLSLTATNGRLQAQSLVQDLKVTSNYYPYPLEIDASNANENIGFTDVSVNLPSNFRLSNSAVDLVETDTNEIISSVTVTLGTFGNQDVFNAFLNVSPGTITASSVKVPVGLGTFQDVSSQFYDTSSFGTPFTVSVRPRIQYVPEPSEVLGILAFGTLGTGTMLKREFKRKSAKKITVETT